MKGMHMKKGFTFIFFLLISSVYAQEEEISLFDVLDEAEALKQERHDEYASISSTDMVYIATLNIIINGLSYDSKDLAEYENEERLGNAVARYGSTLATVMRWMLIREQDRMTMAELEETMIDVKNTLERATSRLESVEYSLTVLDPNEGTQDVAHPILVTISMEDGYRWYYSGGPIYLSTGAVNLYGKDRNFSTRVGYNKLSVYYRDNQLGNLGKNEYGYGKSWLFYDVGAFHNWEVPFLTGEDFSYHKLGMFTGLGINPYPALDIGIRLMANYTWLDNTAGSDYDTWKLPGLLDEGTIEFAVNPYIDYVYELSLPGSKSDKKVFQGHKMFYAYFGIHAPLGLLKDYATEEDDYFVKAQVFSVLRYRYQFIVPNFIQFKARYGMSNEALKYSNMFSVDTSSINTSTSWARRNGYPYEITNGYSVFLLKAEYILRVMDVGIVSTDVYGFVDYGGTSLRYYPDPDDWRIVPGTGLRLNIQAPVYLSFDFAVGFGSSLLGYDDGDIWSWSLDVTFVL